MCCNFPTIKITEGNAFTLIFPLKRRSYVAEKPIDEDIDVTRLTDVRVTLGGVEYAPTIETYGVRIDVPATLVRGTYDGLLTADYDGNAIRGAYESCVQIVEWNVQSNAQQYILGSPVATNAAYVLGYMPTYEEVEELKQQLREQIAAAEQAEAEAIAEKQRCAEAIEHLDDIAQESTLTQGVSDIRNDIATIDIDTTTLAKETTAQQAAADASEAKTAAQGITGYALQGSNPAATNTEILQAIPSVEGLATETNATANKNDVLAAIAANAGIPTLTIPDSTAAQELAPNVLYIFNNRTSTLTLTLGTPIVGVVNEYHFFIVCGSTAPTVNFPIGISWNGGNAPTISAGKTYEVSILNNVAAYFEV